MILLSELRSPNDLKSSKPKMEKLAKDKNEINMNDILLDSICANSLDEHPDGVVEDVVSISPDVVQTVNEDDLRKEMNKPTSTLIENYSPRLDDPSDEDPNEPKMTVNEFIRSESHRVRMEEARLRHPGPPPPSDYETDADSDVDDVEVTPVELQKSSPQEFHVEGVESESEDEVFIDSRSSTPPPLPNNPPPSYSPVVVTLAAPKASRMYDDSDSDSEVEAPAPSPRLSKMEPKEEDIGSIHSDTSSTTTSTSSSNHHDSLASFSDKENRVTRISVKSDGRAEIHSPKSPVRVNLEQRAAGDVITDDEFSEKLI
ncbi:unnamed protein product [Caenorhabditis auriculariae]|uniref:Uncharacterized protein n=1 Tax=Caenorhabditis auriculariae TaxID=2777116 RepID=A0A8S1HB64_9PELO|nr:unnamed protein product [Caenorhabditis auriculariae]